MVSVVGLLAPALDEGSVANVGMGLAIGVGFMLGTRRYRQPTADEDAGPSPGEIPSVKVGKEKPLAITLKRGKYVLICNLPGHYKAGQSTGLNVE